MKYKDISPLQQYKKNIKEAPSFSTVEKVNLIREIKNLSKKKVIHDAYIPVKILKENAPFFEKYI